VQQAAPVGNKKPMSACQVYVNRFPTLLKIFYH
jgi:hypothetical protein